jgi:hypothetical protein
LVEWETAYLAQQAGNRAPLSRVLYGTQSLVDLFAEGIVKRIDVGTIGNGFVWRATHSTFLRQFHKTGLDEMLFER